MFINRQPLMGSEVEIEYLVSVTCRTPEEAHVRALLLQGLAGGGLALRRLDSNDVEGTGRVAVTALMTAPHRVDADVEKIVGRLSLEPTASAARWQVEIHFDSAGRIVWAHRRFASECGIELTQGTARSLRDCYKH